MLDPLTRLPFLSQWRSPHPAYLPSIRTYIVGLAVVLLGLELWNGASSLSLLYPFGIAVALVPPPQQWVGLAAIGAIALGCWAVPGITVSVQAIGTLGIIVVASLVGRSHWVKREWSFAAQSLLASLTQPQQVEGPDQSLRTMLHQVRLIAHADVAMMLQQLDEVAAEVVFSEPEKLIPSRFTTVNLLSEAIAQQCCVYYQEPEKVLAIAPLLYARGVRSLAVIPLRHSEQLAGGMVLIWRSPIQPSSDFQSFLSKLAGGLSTFLRFQDATLHTELLQARLVAILQTIPQGIIFVDESGAQGWLNATAAEQLQLEQGFVSPHAIAQAMTTLRQQATNHDELTLEAIQHFSHPEIPIRDWQWRFANPQRVLSLSSTSVPQRDVPGRLWVIDDITERHLAEEALRRSEERFQWIVQATNDAIWDWDLISNRVWWNEVMPSLFGFIAKEVDTTFNWWADHLHPEDQNRVLSSMMEAIEHGESIWGEEYRYRRADGSYAYVADRGYVIRDAEGAPIRMLGGMIDVTERKEAQAELERQNRRAQLFSEVTLKIRQSLNVSEIVQAAVTEVQAILQADRVLVYQFKTDGQGHGVAEAIKPGLPSLVDQNRSEAYLALGDRLFSFQRGIQQITDIEHDQRIRSIRAELARLGQVQAELVVPIHVGAEGWGVLIAHQCDRPRPWTSFETDLLTQLADQIGIALTQARLFEQETQQRQELARSNTELQQFAYVASHDLQEPLRMVTSYLQLLEKRYSDRLDADAQEFIGYAVDGATRMKRLITDLLSYSRVGTHGRSFERMSCTEVVQQALRNLEVAIAEAEATILYGDLPWIVADAAQLVQVFQNLIGNAIKFRGEHKPCIQIEATLQDTTWLFCVRDNGIGFEPEYADRIFVIFQRLHSRAEYSGTGMGLAICKKIIERHGGTIWAESSPHQGSCFYFTLPNRGDIQHG